ncbi:MAG TPA: VOC family protein [Kofleriaceae bacterium]|nr:VOC family protein [Kofleriaceae bacterium]
MPAKPIPDGHNAVCPYLVVASAAGLIEFLHKTFGATELDRMGPPGGPIVHAEVKIGDSIVMMGEPMGGAAFPAQVHCYVPDVDAAYQRALAAGGTSVREPTTMFYGDRVSMVKDAWGNVWAISTHVEDVSSDEMMRRMASQRPRG